MKLNINLGEWEMNGKSTLTTLATSVILVILIGSLFLVPTVTGVLPGQYQTAWHDVVEGVLDEPFPDDQLTDFDLYPYEKTSLDVGFSKWGELIGIKPGLDPDVAANWVGLDYGGRDPFCPPTVVPMESWINGWFIDIEYVHPTLGDRHMWAMAMFADGFAWGYDWHNFHPGSPGAPPSGGRKTNAYAETEFEVLYHGPRRFVAQSVTHIADVLEPDLGLASPRWDVLDVTITLIFNKVKKEVILLKDVKLTIPKMHLEGKLDVEFSDREQWDLGPDPTYDSYAHFYEQLGKGCYGPEWHLADDLLIEVHDIWLADADEDGDGNPTTFDLTELPVEGYMKVWVDDVPYTDPVFQERPEDYTIDLVSVDAPRIIFTAAPEPDSLVEIHYKRVYKTYDEWDHHYDIAQVISSDLLYVGWTAFWPPVSDFTVDGIGYWTEPLLNVHVADMDVEPKRSPLIIGEWDFLLEHTDIPQFRCVEVKGVTDLNDADDLDIAYLAGFFGIDNVIDREVKFQLDEVLNPWDLRRSVHKKTSRWVQKEDGTGLLADFYFTAHPAGQVPLGDRWDKYSIFAERILVDGVLQVRTVDYELLFDAAGDVEGIRFYADAIPPLDSVIKMLYSTVGAAYRTTTDNENNILAGAADGDMDVYLFNTNPLHPIEFRIVTGGETADAMLRIRAWDIDESGGQKDFVYLNGFYVGELSGWGGRWTIPQFKVDSGMLTGAAEGELVQVFVDVDPTWVIDQEIDPADSETWPTPRTPARWAITVDWGELVFTPGSYEWIIVGRDSRAVDSAGAAMVTEYFDSLKDIEVWLSGLDMQDETFGPEIPYVFKQLRTGLLPDRSGYRDDVWGPNTGRSKLRDSWCCHRDPVTDVWVDGVPIESSNIIVVGGFYANHGAEYLNDFTDAYYDPITEEIVALSCWSQNRYAPVYVAGEQVLGYGVISVYKDLDGTAFFVIWGYTGQDTYYTTWVLWNTYVGHKLQIEPNCLTTIILEFDYTLHPTDECFWEVVEALGTISECDLSLWYPVGKQPPIHPDP